MNLTQFSKTNYNNGEIISDVINFLTNKYEFKNILFLRTPTTGDWLDKLLLNNNNVTRILYDTKKMIYYKCHSNTTKIKHNDLNKTLNSFNKKFDLICIDQFHTYKDSIDDLNIMNSYLSENGIIVMHDCFPSNKDLAFPDFKYYDWCGETYLAFIDFAYNNPQYFYGLMKIDTGIGIISKTHIDPLRNNFDTKKQKYLLSNLTNNPYEYFTENSNDIMNIIEL